MVGEHDFLLNTTSVKSPSTNELVSKINFSLSIKVLNGLSIWPDVEPHHTFILILFRQFLCILINNQPFDNKLFIFLFPLFLIPHQMHLKVLNNTLCLICIMREDILKVMNEREVLSFVIKLFWLVLLNGHQIESH